MTEIEQSEDFLNRLLASENDPVHLDNITSVLNDSQEVPSNNLDDFVDVPTATSNSSNSCMEEENKITCEDTIESSEKSFEDAKGKADEEEWLDIMGSGNFKKKVIKSGLGHETRPQRGDSVTIDVSFYVNDNLFEENKDFKFIIGDLDVIQGIDLAICLMEKEEKAKVIIPSKLAFGIIGRSPDVPPNSDIECDIELKEIETVDVDSLTVSERLKQGNSKRLRGNYFYERHDYIEAIHCYERAVEYLDGIRDCSDSSTEESQEIVDMRIKVYNNMAASHLKLSAYSSALKSVELVLKVQPKNVKALFRKAKILGAQGSTNEAIVCLKIAASLDPDAKIIQVELTKLNCKRKQEEQSQRAMYQRMFPQNKPKKISPLSKVLKWSTVVTGGVLVVAAGLAAYRNYHS